MPAYNPSVPMQGSQYIGGPVSFSGGGEPAQPMDLETQEALKRRMAQYPPETQNRMSSAYGMAAMGDADMSMRPEASMGGVMPRPMPGGPVSAGEGGPMPGMIDPAVAATMQGSGQFQRGEGGPLPMPMPIGGSAPPQMSRMDAWKDMQGQIGGMSPEAQKYIYEGLGGVQGGGGAKLDYLAQRMGDWESQQLLKNPPAMPPGGGIVADPRTGTFRPKPIPPWAGGAPGQAPGKGGGMPVWVRRQQRKNQRFTRQASPGSQGQPQPIMPNEQQQFPGRFGPPRRAGDAMMGRKFFAY